MNRGHRHIGAIVVAPSSKKGMVLNGEELSTFTFSLDKELQSFLLKTDGWYGNVEEIGMQGIIAAWIGEMVHSASCGGDHITAMAEKPPRKIRRVK